MRRFLMLAAVFSTASPAVAWVPSAASPTVAFVANAASPTIAANAVAAPESRSEAILASVARVAERLTSTRYNHSTIVDEKSGRYEFDCSGFVSWVLRRSAPGAHAAFLARSKTGRPLARDFYREIAAAPAEGKAPRGVRRVARVEDARPGDIVAWLKPDVLRSPHTGHVGFVLAAPEPVPGLEGGYLVRIADASSYRHQDDDREESGRTGFGSGTILLVADPISGAPRAYGWFGLYSRYVLETPIAIGRALR